MDLSLRLRVSGRSPIPIRWQLAEQLKHAIESGAIRHEQALPSIRELAGFLSINPNTVARAIEDLKRSGYVESRRGKGVFVASTPSSHPAPALREDFLRDVVIRAAALGMGPDDVAAGILTVASAGLEAVRDGASVLLVECSRPELDFFERELQAHLPVRVSKVLLRELEATVRRQARSRRWAVAATSFAHLPQVERSVRELGISVIALLAEVHLETLHQLAQLPPRTRVGVVASAGDSSHSLEHSIIAAALPNIARVESAPADGDGLGRLVRRVDALVCSSSMAARVRRLVAAGVPVIIDDRALNQRAIQTLGAILAQRNGGRTAVPATGGPSGPAGAGTRAAAGRVTLGGDRKGSSHVDARRRAGSG